MHEIEYTYRKGELIWESAKICWKRREYILTLSLFILVFLALAVATIYDRDLWAWTVIAVNLPIAIFLSPLYWARRALNSSRASFPLKNTLRFDKHGITIVGQLTRHELPWQTFVKWREDDNYFLLYQTFLNAVIVPKRAFTQEQMADFRSCLNAIPDKTARPI